MTMASLDITTHNKLQGFQKLAFLTRQLDISQKDIANIVEEPEDLVAEVLRSGLVPQQVPDREVIEQRLYLLRILFSDLFRLTGYQVEETRQLVRGGDIFAGCPKPPPWYPAPVLEYLL